jgi:hypothetical protein
MSAEQLSALSETGYTPLEVIYVTSVRVIGQPHFEFCARAMSAVESPLSTMPGGRTRFGEDSPASRLSSVHVRTAARATDADWTALLRDLLTKCRRLRADGVLDVHLSAVGDEEVQYQAIGTAVRDSSASRVGPPFLSHVSATEFAKLLRAGWYPAGMMVGSAVGMRHETIPGRRGFGPAAWRNAEIVTWSDVFQRTRAAARDDLRAKVEDADAAGALLAWQHTYTSLHSCQVNRGKNRVVRATFAASTIVPSPHAIAGPSSTLTVLAVNPPTEATEALRSSTL